MSGSSVCYRVQGSTAGYETDLVYTRSLDRDVKSSFDSERDYVIQNNVNRKLLWERIFGDEPMPAEEHDAATKYAGSLGADLENITDEDIAEVLAEADE